MTAYDGIGVLGWLALGLAYAWAVSNFARPWRGAPVSGSPTDPAKVVELRGRRGGGRDPGAERDPDRGDAPSRRASGF